MTKIVLYTVREPNQYRAVIAGGGTGWAYPFKTYRDGETEVLEATVDQYGKIGAAVYRFTFDGVHWTTDSDPILNPYSRL